MNDEVNYQFIENLRNTFADPTSDDFDIKKVQEVEHDTTDEKVVRFLIEANSTYTELKKAIFLGFDRLNSNSKDIKRMLFEFVNKKIIEIHSKSIQQLMNTKSAFEPEKIAFAEYLDEDGNSSSLEHIIEAGGDILSKLLEMLDSWEKIGNEKLYESQIDNEEEKNYLLSTITICSNVIVNLKESAYDLLVYENAEISINEETEFKILTKNKGLALINQSNRIRISNNIHEWYLPFIKIFEKSNKAINGIHIKSIENGKIFLEVSEKRPALKLARAQANIFLFHDHLANEKLSYFDDYELFDLVEVLVCLEELVESIFLLEDAEKATFAPFHISKRHLINVIRKCTSKPYKFISKVVAAMVSEEPFYSFWKSPLLEVGKDFFIPISPLLSPNHNIYIDKLLTIAKIDTNYKVEKYKLFVQKELFNSDRSSYQLDNIPLTNDKLKDCLLIETKDWLLLIGLVVYDLPYSSKDKEATLYFLGNSIISLNERSGLIKEIQASKSKPIIPILLCNYPLYSGISINNVSIIDLTLFKNYFFTGNIKRAATSFSDTIPKTTEVSVIPYYTNETECNDNLISFLDNPTPLAVIMQRLTWKDVPLSPKGISSSFVAESITHLPDDKLIDIHIKNLSNAINIEYYNNPNEKERAIIDTSISFSLSSFFHQMAHADYKDSHKRIEAYNTLKRTKYIGFAHLIHYITQSIDQLSQKKVDKDETFEGVPYNDEEAFALVKKVIGDKKKKVRLSDFEYKGDLTSENEKQVVSFIIHVSQAFNIKKYTEEELYNIYFQVILLRAFLSRHKIDEAFYGLCNNYVQILNHNHKFQQARDFCEEVLILSINRSQSHHGWGLFFKCFTMQRNQFEASIYGSIFISSLIGLSKIPYFILINALLEFMKFYREFGLSKLTKATYESIMQFELKEYDKHKVTLSYFNSFLQSTTEKPEQLNEVINYLETNINQITSYGEHGCIVWLGLLYNFNRLMPLGFNSNTKSAINLIRKLESNCSQETIANVKATVLGDSPEYKAEYIKSLLNIQQTRSVEDSIYEIQLLSVVTENLVSKSLIKNDLDGLFLAGFVLNDQTLTYESIILETGTLIRLESTFDKKLSNRLNNYSTYLLNELILNKNQLFIWIFTNHNKVYALLVNSDKKIDVKNLSGWDLKKMHSWLKSISGFYFNSQKESYYDISAQEEDYKKLLTELEFTEFGVEVNNNELLISSSLDLASFPFNLFVNQNNFIGASHPVSNVISIEWLNKNGKTVTINSNWKSSAWIPINDGDGTINWGYSKISPILESINTEILTKQYPEKPINTEINFFLAHGELDPTGFKAIYTNDKNAVLYPNAVFGSGEIAVLFICNSGSSKDEHYSNSISSFSQSLLSEGYKAVVAPFWPFDVSISPIWLAQFIESFIRNNESISNAVYNANKKVAEYDEATSSVYYAAQGQLAMHLYGNPNIYVAKSISD